MAVLTFVVGKEYDGERLDSFLRKQAGISSSVIKRSKNISGGLTIDGDHIRTVDKVWTGATIRVDTGEEFRSYHKSEITVDVAYEDEGLIVYNKPSDMPSHPSKGHPFDTLGNVFASGTTTAGLTYRPINRLDKDTSGLVFVAKNQHAASFFASRIHKTYLAVVTGNLSQDTGTIIGAIEREEPDSMRRIVREDGQHAVTHYKVLLRKDSFTMVELSLETGRTHQIRVHMSHIGHPLLGDTLYGGTTELIQRQALHCGKATILLENNETIDVFAPLPQDFSSII